MDDDMQVDAVTVNGSNRVIDIFLNDGSCSYTRKDILDKERDKRIEARKDSLETVLNQGLHD